MTDHADLTKLGPWRAERVWSKHHERIPDRWEWLIEDDAGVVAIVPADDPEHAEAVARFIAEAADALDAADAEIARLRAALFDVTHAVMQEAEAHRYGQPAYDMTLDHLYEIADHHRSVLAVSEEATDV